MGKIHALYIYPVKSCKGVSVSSAIATPSGLKYDREWIIIHRDTGKMITQRTHPQMTQIECSLTGAALTLSFNGTSFSIDFNTTGDIIDGVVWGTNVQGVGQAVDGFDTALNAFLDTDDAVLMHFTGNRQIKTSSADVNGALQYADKYPYTVADTADLNALNIFFADNDLPPVGIERFRANIILDGVRADVGTHHDTFIIDANNTAVQGTFCEPCTRCPIPDIDPVTGEKTTHKMQRSLKTLRDTEKDWFSTHSVLDLQEEIVLSVGDSVQVQ